MESLRSPTGGRAGTPTNLSSYSFPRPPGQGEEEEEEEENEKDGEGACRGMLSPVVIGDMTHHPLHPVPRRPPPPPTNAFLYLPPSQQGDVDELAEGDDRYYNEGRGGNQHIEMSQGAAFHPDY